MNPHDQARLELDKLHSKLHEEWLKHPVTKQALDVLRKRKEEYKKSLQEGILTESNEKRETNYRTAMSTADALLVILSDSSKFIEYINKQ